MNGELDKLQARLQELIGEILRIKNEIFSIKKMQKNGEKLVRKDLRHLYELEDQLENNQKEASEIKAKIEEIRQQEKSTSKEEKDNSYALSHDMIPYRTIDVYRQVATVDDKDKKTPIDMPKQPVMPEFDPNTIKREKLKRIGESALIAALLVGIGAAGFKLIDEIADRKEGKKVEDSQVPSSDQLGYDYNTNTYTIPAATIPADPYANIPNFVEMYRNDYENARTLYNITANDAVDYVNRAYSIQASNFFQDASIDDVVQILMAIDNKDIFLIDNGNLAQAIHTSINRITESYLFREGPTSEEDINKINALKYFAKDGSDLDSFLTRYSDIVIDILRNPEDDTKKDTLYSFINIFATSVNGFNNTQNYLQEFPESGEELALTDDYWFNQDAQLNDANDWLIAHHEFFVPLAPIGAPYNDTDERMGRWIEVQQLMETALQSPMISEICGESLNLGGN